MKYKRWFLAFFNQLFLSVSETHATTGTTMDFNLRQLRMLREVAERGTIAAAAESLGYTASAVSQQLSTLEKSTGVAVLERIGRNVRLTDAGRELVRHADHLLAGMEAAQAAVEQVNKAVRGVLHVTVFESVATTLLAPLLSRLAVDYPELELRTQQSDPDLAMDAVAMGEIDLAFAIDYRHAPAPRRTDIIRHTLMEDRFHVLVPEDDSLVGSVTLAELADRPFICSPLNLSCGRCVAMACRDTGFEPNVVHQLDDYPTTLHLVAAGQGVALVPDLGLVIKPPGVRVLRLDPPLSRVVQIAYRAASAERPSIVAVRDTLQDIVDDLVELAA
jgi:molybdate transport repressor ModE-like protein